MDDLLAISDGPHVRADISTKKIMWAVTLALVPAGLFGIFAFGFRCLFVIAVSIITAVTTEMVISAIKKKDISSIYDGSAFLTGLLLAYNLSPRTPLWMAAIGSFFAIAVAKHAFGGLGRNIFNPALAGRALLMIVWPRYMVLWQNPWWKADAVTSATPLVLYKYNKFALLSKVSDLGLFFGNRGGCIGEICIIALLAGAAFLFIKKYITWHIPFAYIMTVGALSWAFNGRTGLFSGDGLFFVLAGGLILGAFFMATDYVTSPLSARGKILFGLGCGILTFLIRKYSIYPEGVCYAILAMNALTPWLDKVTFPKWRGYQK